MNDDSATSPRDVSVVIPCYNAAAWVGDTIESVLTQRLPPSEIIAVNDGSTDETARVLAAFGSRVTVVTQENRGLGGARNAGALAARSVWLTFLDADDLHTPDTIAAYVELHEAFPDAAVLFSDFEEFDADGRRDPASGSRYLADLERFAGRGSGRCSLLTPPAELLVARNGAFTPSCLMIRRDVFLGVGQFDECRDRQGAEDLDLYFRLLPDQPIAFVRSTAVLKRRHTSNMSRHVERMRQATERALERADALYGAKHPHLLPILRRKQAGLLAGWAERDVLARHERAVPTSLALVKVRPLSVRAWWLLARAFATR